jgi:hypothetical protein
VVKDLSESNNGKDQSLQPTAGHSMHTYEIRPRKDGRGFDVISDALPSERLWYLEVRQAIDYAKHQSRSRDAVIRVYDVAGKLIEVHRHKGDFQGW